MTHAVSTPDSPSNSESRRKCRLEPEVEAQPQPHGAQMRASERSPGAQEVVTRLDPHRATLVVNHTSNPESRSRSERVSVPGRSALAHEACRHVGERARDGPALEDVLVADGTQRDRHHGARLVEHAIGRAPAWTPVTLLY